MDRKSLKWLAVVLLGIISLSAFTLIPTVKLTHTGKEMADVDDMAAQASEGKVDVVVNYESVGEYFEIGKDIIVATDRNFTNILRMKKCVPNEGNYVYEFAAPSGEKIDSIYIKPPILYIPAEIIPVSVPLVVGRTASISGEDIKPETGGRRWFSVDKVDVVMASEGQYVVTVTVGGTSLDLPRFPKLQIGDTEISGTSALHFDENDNFQYGEFLFNINANSEEDLTEKISSSKLVVRDALIRVDSSDLLYSSSVKSISVTVNDSE